MQAHNGSGKTTCFVLAMLSRVDPTLNQPQAMCVCPTRELVVQNLEVLQKMGKFTSIAAMSTAVADFELPRHALAVCFLSNDWNSHVPAPCWLRTIRWRTDPLLQSPLQSCLHRGSRITQQVVIGTHGKLKNWASKRMLLYRFMKILVLDEADEMLKVSCVF